MPRPPLALACRLVDGDDVTVRDLSHSVIYKAMGEIRERMQHGETIKNKGGYLLTLLKIQAAKQRLSWGKK